MARTSRDATVEEGGVPMSDLIRVQRDGPVAVLTLNRPDRLNAMTNAMDSEFWDALASIYADPALRAIVWRAEGRAFSAGRDVGELGSREPGVSHFQYISTGHARTHE